VYGLNTSKKVWAALAKRFANQSLSHISTIKQQLQNLRQGSKSCSDYLQSAKSPADQLAVIGKPLDDEDMISSIINGLNPSFINFLTNFAFATMEKSLNFDEFEDMLLNHEMLLNIVATPDVSTFALFAQKAGPHNFNQKPKGPHQLNRPQPHHYSKPNGYPAFKSQQQISHPFGFSRFSNSSLAFPSNRNMQQQQQPQHTTSNLSPQLMLPAKSVENQAINYLIVSIG
jgi:hypothetical protein